MIKPQFEDAEEFSEGLAAVNIEMKDKEKGKWGFIDKTGKFAIKPQFNDASFSLLSDGLAPVETGGKYGFIDRTGKFVIEPQFEVAGTFREGLAYTNGDNQGYIDKTGKLIIRYIQISSSAGEIDTTSEMKHIICPYGYGEDSSGAVACKDKPIDVRIVH